MWGLAEVIGSGMDESLPGTLNRPPCRWAPALIPPGKTLFSASSCLLRCLSDQTRVACEQRSLAGRGHVPLWLTF